MESRQRTARVRRVAARAALAAALAAGLAVAGCGDSGSSSSSDGGTTTADGGAEVESLAFANAREADPQLKKVGDTLQQMAEQEGIDFSRFDNKFDPAASLQNARLIAQQRPQVAVEWSAVADANNAIGAQLERAGIPCIAMSVRIPSCSLINQDNAKLGADLGAYAASVAKRRGWTAEDTTLIVVNAPFIGPELNKLPTNFYSSYAKAFPDMQQMAPEDITPTTTRIGDLNAVLVDGRGELQTTNKVVRDALTTIPEGRHLMVGAVINDDSALGALRALEQTGRIDDALIVAAGADRNGLRQLRTNPRWIADGSVFFELWPKYVLPMVKAKAAGAELPEVTPAPQAVLTHENVDDYYDAAGNVIADPPIPAGAAYLEEHGLS